jgi:hypothetical protein
MAIPTSIFQWEARNFPVMEVLKTVGTLEGAGVTRLIIRN